MGAKLDVNIVSSEPIDVIKIIDYYSNYYHVSIESISSIKSWNWEDERIITTSEIDNSLKYNRIVVMHLIINETIPMGLFIEKDNGRYIYLLWKDVSLFPELDKDYITITNIDYYDRIYMLILKAEKHLKINYELIAIGVETVFNYSRNYSEMVALSKNIISWLFRRNQNTFVCDRTYVKRIFNEVVVYERQSLLP